ncbi:MAG: DUF1573 domain-containing protein [Bacteroidota bacterium]|nr:DUF1573 domain-containing protein [Bacteroidota bacterium]
MKNLLTVVLLLIASMRLSAQAPVAAPDPNAPVITFVETEINFGTIVYGAEAIRVFTFTNTGKTPLIITSIKGQCGCTTLPEGFPKDPIPPGGTASFKVKYDTMNRPGMFDKKITVISNASVPSVEVKIKGTVLPAGTPATGGN